MLVNFSNHPSRYWDDKQREASLCYGDIIDLSFPAVAPNSDKTQIHALAQDCVHKIVAMGDVSDITVHIMGEMTLTYIVVSKLKELGIKCIASTTVRKTTYDDNGTKLSEFQFVKFREY